MSLAAFVLAPLLAAGQPSGPFEGWGSDYPPYNGYGGGLRGIYPDAAAGYEQFYSAEDQEGRSNRRREGRLWVPAPEPASRSGYYDGYGVPSYPYPESSLQPGLYEQFRPSYDDVPVNLPGRTTGSMPSHNDPPGPGRGYRFRGEEAWGGDQWQGVYRFRPLTEQEKERMRRDFAWRPSTPYESRERWPESQADDHAGEAYGYQPESWFQRYYGERP